MIIYAQVSRTENVRQTESGGAGIRMVPTNLSKQIIVPAPLSTPYKKRTLFWRLTKIELNWLLTFTSAATPYLCCCCYWL